MYSCQKSALCAVMVMESSGKERVPGKDFGRIIFNIVFYGSGGFFGVWLLLSMLLHLYGDKNIESDMPAISANADRPAELYNCWEDTYSLFDELVDDFAQEINLMRLHSRNLKSTWGEKYGWDLLPAGQLPAVHRTLEHAGAWRYKLLQTWSRCRLRQKDVVKKTSILATLRKVHVSLDLLRIGLTKRIRSFSDPGRTQLEGGTQKLIKDIRAELQKSGRLAIKLMRSAGKNPDYDKLRKWRFKE